MTAYKFTSHRHLRDALNNIETVQKKDIKDFSWGHLNERNLYKQSLLESQGRIWKSSKKRKTPIRDKDLLPDVRIKGSNREDDTDQKMTDILYQFSVGTTGSIPVPPRERKVTPPNRKKLEDFKKETSVTSKVPIKSSESATRAESAKSVYSQLNDGILVEELDTQEMMVQSPRPKHPFNKNLTTGLSPRDPNYDIMADLKQTLDPDGYLTVKHSFLPSFKSGITKQDQYNRMQQFEDTVLRKQDCREQKVLSGIKAVEHLERRLEEDLQMMNLNGMGPNFHKLQVFSNSFEDLIEDTSTFGYTLNCIKTEYDSYISKLLDSQTPQHSRLLRDQVQQMSARGTSRPEDLSKAKNRVDKFENEAWKLLEENQKLREQLAEEEEWLANAPEPEPHYKQLTSFTHKDDTPIELADELEHRKALIMEKYDALLDLRRKLRQEYVPLTVCTHLEQCIKETEIEVQKLLKQNEYFERSNNEMEAELKESIQDADTSERDARRIWKKVNSLRGLPRVNLNSQEGYIEDSEDEQDDETKWNWYIS